MLYLSDNYNKYSNILEIVFFTLLIIVLRLDIIFYFLILEFICHSVNSENLILK